jgi:hypothetical protein
MPESNELMPGSNAFNIRIEAQEHDPWSKSDAILILSWVDAHLSGLILILKWVDAYLSGSILILKWVDADLSGLILILKWVDAYLSGSILILKWSILILNPVDPDLDPLAS